MRSEHLLLAALLTTAALGFAPDAKAFCRTTTTPAPPDFQPSTDGCFNQGQPLYHQSLCVPYHLLTPESRALPTAVLSNAIASAFTTWTSTNATCSPGITGVELAPVHDVKIVDYKTGERTSNVFGVVQGP